MKAKGKKELINKSLIELKTLLKQAKEELLKLKIDLVSKKLKNVHSYALKRKEIAQISTVIREKELTKKE